MSSGSMALHANSAPDMWTVGGFGVTLEFFRSGRAEGGLRLSRVFIHDGACFL